MMQFHTTAVRSAKGNMLIKHLNNWNEQHELLFSFLLFVGPQRMHADPGWKLLEDDFSKHSWISIFLWIFV